MEKKRQKIPYEEYHKEIDNLLYKKCSICEEWFPCNTEYFYKKKSSKRDGVSSYCKLCEREKGKQYNRTRVEVQKEYHRKWHIKNRKTEIEKKLQYNKDHWAYKQEYSKQWRQSENGKKIMRYHAKKYLNKAHKISKKEWESCKNYFINSKGEFICAYCGMTISEHRELYGQDFHKEHIYYDGRSDLKNCIPSCKKCNTSKHQDSFNDWYNPNNPVYTYERYHKICKWIQYDCKNYITKKKPKGKYTKKKVEYWKDKNPINF